MIITETKRYAACPECGGKIGTIDHLVADEIVRVGPWFCGDCGHSWWIRTNGRNVCELESCPELKIPATVTLVLPPQTKPIAFTLRTHDYERPNQKFGEGSAYFYDWHTCPTNWMRDVNEIRIGDNADPHGLFQFENIERGHLKRDRLTGNLIRTKPETR